MMDDVFWYPSNCSEKKFILACITGELLIVKEIYEHFPRDIRRSIINEGIIFSTLYEFPQIVEYLSEDRRKFMELYKKEIDNIK